MFRQSNGEYNRCSIVGCVDRMAGNHSKKAKVMNCSLLPLFFNLCRAWNLNEGGQLLLLGIGTDALSALTAGESQTLTPELAERIVELLEIYGQLHALYPYDPDLVDKWIMDCNAHYYGLTPLAFMQQQRMDGIVAVRKYLASI